MNEVYFPALFPGFPLPEELVEALGRLSVVHAELDRETRTIRLDAQAEQYLAEKQLQALCRDIEKEYGLRELKLSVRFPDERAVRRLAQRLAATAGRRLDDASPYVDARLPDGARLHAVLPPVAPEGTCLSLRLPRRRAFTIDELVAAGTVPAGGAQVLRALVRARAAFLVTGGTGTGKTTLLAALLSMVDAGERLVLVEDSAELRPNHDHAVRLETRPPNVEGAGGVVLRDLVRQALRMRPDRLVVGEVRGGEVVDLLAALNTGHEGGCGTLHANTAADVPARVEALAVAAGLSREAVHSQLTSAIDVVLHVVRDPAGGCRRVGEIRVLRRGPDELVTAVPAVTFEPGGEVRQHEGVGLLARRLGGALDMRTANPGEAS